MEKKMKRILFAILVFGSCSCMLFAEELQKNNQKEEVIESLFQAMRFWSSLDVISDEEPRLSNYDRIELWRKEHKLEKEDMTNIFAKVIQDFLVAQEKKSGNKELAFQYIYAKLYLKYYPIPQKEYKELIQKTFKLAPNSVGTLISGYIKAYPDWIFDDKPIIEIIQKSNPSIISLVTVYCDISDQITKEKNDVRKKKLLDKTFEWALQDDKLEIFHDLDRILLDHYKKDYATQPGRKLQLEKDLKRYEEAMIYDWVYRRTKYALEHFDKGDEAFEMLYKMDTDPKLRDGEWERSERERLWKEGIEEAKKMGIDVSTSSFSETVYEKK